MLRTGVVGDGHDGVVLGRLDVDNRKLVVANSVHEHRRRLFRRDGETTAVMQNHSNGTNCLFVCLLAWCLTEQVYSYNTGAN